MRILDYHDIEQAILNLKDKEFDHFYEWMEKVPEPEDRLANKIERDELKQTILNLSEEDFYSLWDWVDELWTKRWSEEVENNPFSRKCLELGNMIMNKPDPAKFIADLLKPADKSNGK